MMTSMDRVVYNRIALSNHIKTARPFLNQKEKRSSARLENFLRSRSKDSIRLVTYPDKLFRLGLSSYKFEVKFFFKAVKKLVNCSSFNFDCLVNFYVRAGKTSKRKKFIKSIPSAETLKNSIMTLAGKGKDHHAMLLILMFLSGRRAADFKRLRARNITRLDECRFMCRLDKDKKHNHYVDFVLSFEVYEATWCFWNRDVAIRKFERLIMEEEVFKPVTLACFARDAGLHPHSLRSVRAILLIQQGRSDSEVCEYIGWDDTRALRLYTRLPREVIRGLTWGQLLEKLEG